MTNELDQSKIPVLYILVELDHFTTRVMGCITSSTSFDEYCKTTEWYEWQEQLHIIQLHKIDVERLYSVFQRMDNDLSGHVHYLDLVGHLGVDRTKFNVAMFSMFDQYQCKSINFMEFVVIMWNFCTLSKDSLSKWSTLLMF